MDPALWFAFLAAVFILQLPPGPDSMLVMARGIGQGRRVSLFTVLGMTLGAGLIQLPLLALGIASLISASPLAFHLLRLLGAAYLVWLGVKLLFAPASVVSARPVAQVGPLTAAREGMVANLINPWPISVMVAFLPQFVDPAQGSITVQMLLLGATQKLSGVVVLGAYALASGSAGAWLMRHPRFGLWQQRVAGCFMVGLGLRMAFAGAASK